jgi:hypothetical protein
MASANGPERLAEEAEPLLTPDDSEPDAHICSSPTTNSPIHEWPPPIHEWHMPFTNGITS